MTREEIKEIKNKSLLAASKGPFYTYTLSPMRLVDLCTLALEALDKRDAAKKQEIVNDTADTNSFHAGGTGYGAYPTRE